MTDTCNRDYFIEQFPDLADVFRPKSAAQKSLATPTPRKAKPQPLPLKAPERAGNVIVLTMPLPPRELQPNQKIRLHHYKRAKLTKATRNAAGMYMHVALQGAQDWRNVRLDVTLWTARKLDTDSVWGWLKATRDGIADAMKVDDSGFELGTITQHTGKQSGDRREVELTLTRLA